MANLDDLVAAAERLRQASGARHEALATMTGLQRAIMRNELPPVAVDFIEGRMVAELMPSGAFEGRIARHVLMAAMADAVRVGMRYGREHPGEEDQ